MESKQDAKFGSRVENACLLETLLEGGGVGGSNTLVQVIILLQNAVRKMKIFQNFVWYGVPKIKGLSVR